MKLLYKFSKALVFKKVSIQITLVVDKVYNFRIKININLRVLLSIFVA